MRHRQSSSGVGIRDYAAYVFIWIPLWAWYVYYSRLFSEQIISANSLLVAVVICSWVFPVSIYWGWSIIVDLVWVRIATRHAKIQWTKPQVTLSEFIRIAPRIIVNQVAVQLPYTIFLGQFMFIPLIGSERLLEIPAFSSVVKDLIMFAIVGEFAFYYFHRLCHANKFLFNNVHSLHHTFDAPFGFTTIYCHWFEHLLVNMTPVMLGPFLMRAPLATIMLWVSISTITSVGSHSGHSLLFMPSSEQHDWHHLHYNENFGLLGICDSFHNTNSKFLKYMASSSDTQIEYTNE